MRNTSAALSSFSECDQMDTVVIHIGVRDCRAQGSHTGVAKDIEALMTSASDKYKNALIMYSAALMTRDSRLNDTLIKLNEHMRNFCMTRDCMEFIEHRKLQSADHCYEDDIHLDSGEGTKTLVKDITSTYARYTQNKSGKVTVSRNGGRKVHMSGNDNNSDVIKLLTIKLLSQL